MVFYLFLPLCFLISSSLLAKISPIKQESIKKEVTNSSSNSSSVEENSRAIGYLIGQTLSQIEGEVDIELVIATLKENRHKSGKLLKEEEYIQKLQKMQETVVKKIAEANLAYAENFLAKNREKRGVFCLEDGKIQYKVEKRGTGKQVDPEELPLIDYSCDLIQFKKKEGQLKPEQIAISQGIESIYPQEMVPGVRTILPLMKEGDIWTIYLHPTQGYGTSRSGIPPNALLVFKIQVLKSATELKEGQSSPVILNWPDEEQELTVR